MTNPSALTAASGHDAANDGPAAPGLPAAPAAPAMRAAPPAPPCQRWRLYVAQPAAGVPERGAGEGGRSWAAILASSALPLAGEGIRVRVAPAAALPVGIAGEREVVDVYLAERRTIAEVRAAVVDALPPRWELVDLHDAWVGAPAAPAAVVAADYRVVVAGAARWALEGAALALLEASSLPRERRREKKTTTYDLRPLLLDLSVRGGSAEGVTLAMRLRHAPDAVGRPEEVVAALGDRTVLVAGEPATALRSRPIPPLGELPAPTPGALPAPAVGELTAPARPLVVRSVVRERLIMAGDPGAPERS